MGLLPLHSFLFVVFQILILTKQHTQTWQSPHNSTFTGIFLTSPQLNLEVLGKNILYIKLQNGMFKNTNKYLKDQNNVNNMTALAFPLYENTKQRTCVLYKVLAVSIIITS